MFGLEVARKMTFYIHFTSDFRQKTTKKKKIYMCRLLAAESHGGVRRNGRGRSYLFFF